MKNLLLLTSAILSFEFASHAQITAGSVPSGMSISYPGVSLSINVCNLSDTTAFDIDCDGVSDMYAYLYKGYTAVDGANMAILYLTNASFQICRDSVYPNRPHYYTYADTLVCTGTDQWANDTSYILGDYGCLVCFGPAIETNMYIAYKKVSQVGWIKLSFNLPDGGVCSAASTFSISQVLSPCAGNGINTISSENNFSISPNPFSSTTILHTNKVLEDASLILYNYHGQVVKQMGNLSGQNITIQRDNLTEGIFFFRIEEADNPFMTGKLVIMEN